MFRTTKLYTCMAVVLAVICVIFLSNCGGGGNSSVVPNTNPTTENPVSYTNPTPTPVLSNVNVSGYLYVNNTVTEDGETVPSISVLDVPACQSDSSGNESFLTQFSNSIKADYPEDWAKAEIQELYAQLNKTLSESKPLPEYNAQAQLCSTYDDTSIPVGSDGHFDNTVLTGAADSTVKLEVALGEDNYAEVETLPSSDSINSSDATSAAVLKSCPEKIFAFPGEILIFKVYSEPGINLKSAGLKFTLNNPSIGCITQPVYLCLFGAHKYQVAYGCVYIKHGLDTPVDTTITAKLNSGQSMSIFLEVIKKTVSVSGTVYTGGMPLVKGFVYSIGPRSYCKLDSNGAYTLLKVFRGHERSVVAVWQTSENGKKVRHREEKVIDFLNADVTGFNFGVLPTPTPTLTPTATFTPRLPSDPFYNKIALEVIDQKREWQNELGTIQGVQKTVDWLNNNVPEGPPIPEGIEEAIIDQYNNNSMWIGFKGGMWIQLYGNFEPWIIPDRDPETINSQGFLEKYYRESNYKATTVSNRMIVFAPFLWTQESIEKTYKKSVYKDIADELDALREDPANPDSAKLYEVKREITHFDLYGLDTVNEATVIENNEVAIIIHQNANVVRPIDYEQIDQYGIIYIATHGFANGIAACQCYYYRDSSNQIKIDEQLQQWMDDDDNKIYDPTNPSSEGIWWETYVENAETHNRARLILLSQNFFNTQKFGNSIVYLDACQSWAFHETYGGFNSAKVYLGYGDAQASYIPWGTYISYYFFRYLMHNFENPVNIPGYTAKSPTLPIDLTKPMRVKDAYDILENIGASPDPIKKHKPPLDLADGCKLRLDTQNGLYDDTYFPAPITITVERK